MSGDDERAADTVEEMIKKQLEKKEGRSQNDARICTAFARTLKQPYLRSCPKSAKSFVFWR